MTEMGTLSRINGGGGYRNDCTSPGFTLTLRAKMEKLATTIVPADLVDWKLEWRYTRATGHGGIPFTPLVMRLVSQGDDEILDIFGDQTWCATSDI